MGLATAYTVEMPSQKGPAVAHEEPSNVAFAGFASMEFGE